MSNLDQGRIIGAMILVSVAVIFLPMLFDEVGPERRGVSRLPAHEPVAREPLMSLNVATDEWAFIDAAQQHREHSPGLVGLPRHERVTEAEFEAALEAGPGLDDSGVPYAWSLQLAAFRTYEQAEHLRQTLLDDGFEAYVIKLPEGSLLHAVSVGPSLNVGELGRLRGQLAERYDLEGTIVRFTLVRPGADDGVN